MILTAGQDLNEAICPQHHSLFFCPGESPAAAFAASGMLGITGCSRRRHCQENHCTDYG